MAAGRFEMVSRMSEAWQDVAVVVVGMNAREFVRKCFASLERAEWRSYTYEVIYVDNGSTDGTVAMLRGHFPQVKVIANDRNLGYCRAANQGARLARSTYLLFLNDDTEVIGDATATLVDYMERNRHVATAGARLIFADGREQWSGRRFPTLASAVIGRRSWLAKVLPNLATVRSYMCKDEVLRGEPFEADWVSAAGQIFRQDEFWAVGGYAEDYYYWHEMAVCLRLARRGRSIVLVPDAKIIHHEGQGSGPRPYHRQRFHIIDFHRGAYRVYREYKRLGPWSPRAWTVGAALGVRAGTLLAYWRIRSLLPAGRVSGDVPPAGGLAVLAAPAARALGDGQLSSPVSNS
jgi:GT2 family glycosyltransferase